MPPKQQTLNVVDIAQLQATIIDLQQQIQRLQAGDEAKQQEQSTSIKYGIKEAKENVPKLDAKKQGGVIQKISGSHKPIAHTDAQHGEGHQTDQAILNQRYNGTRRRLCDQ